MICIINCICGSTISLSENDNGDFACNNPFSVCPIIFKNNGIIIFLDPYRGDKVLLDIKEKFTQDNLVRAINFVKKMKAFI